MNILLYLDKHYKIKLNFVFSFFDTKKERKSGVRLTFRMVHLKEFCAYVSETFYNKVRRASELSAPRANP